jgi:hypothetical protein
MINTNENTATAQGVSAVTLALEEFRSNVESAYPSIYTKEDVKFLIDDIQMRLVTDLKAIKSPEGTPDTEVLENLKAKLKSSIEDIIDSHDYDDNAEFEISGRQISMDFSSRYLNDEVMEAIDEAWDEVVVKTEDEN